MKKEHTLAYQYEIFLEKMQLDERYMHPQQIIQLKQTFYAAWGTLLILLRDDISHLEIKKGVEIMYQMTKQISDYWEEDLKRQAGSRD